MPNSRSGRTALLGLCVLFGMLATGFLGGSGASFFPDQYSHAFYVTKGIVGVVAVILILIHMSRAWPNVGTSGQRLRYIALLMVTILIASGSTAQLDEGVPVSGRNIGALLAALLVIAAMVVSIRQDRRP
jgi:hypothetical protein